MPRPFVSRLERFGDGRLDPARRPRVARRPGVDEVAIAVADDADGRSGRHGRTWTAPPGTRAARVRRLPTRTPCAAACLAAGRGRGAGDARRRRGRRRARATARCGSSGPTTSSLTATTAACARSPACWARPFMQGDRLVARGGRHRGQRRLARRRLPARAGRQHDQPRGSSRAAGPSTAKALLAGWLARLEPALRGAASVGASTPMPGARASGPPAAGWRSTRAAASWPGSPRAWMSSPEPCSCGPMGRRRSRRSDRARWCAAASSRRRQVGDVFLPGLRHRATPPVSSVRVRQEHADRHAAQRDPRPC